jgi:hypothetical protein
MAAVNLAITFEKPVNASLQVGDLVLQKLNEDIIEVGSCTALSTDRKIVTVLIQAQTPRPETSTYLLFAKNNKINTSGLAGYYSEITMTNDRTDDIELYAVNANVFKSSS